MQYFIQFRIVIQIIITDANIKKREPCKSDDEFENATINVWFSVLLLIAYRYV